VGYIGRGAIPNNIFLYLYHVYINVYCELFFSQNPFIFKVFAMALNKKSHHF